MRSTMFRERMLKISANLAGEYVPPLPKGLWPTEQEIIEHLNNMPVHCTMKEVIDSAQNMFHPKVARSAPAK